MNLLATAPDMQADLSPAARAVLLTGSAGFLFANFTAQLLSAHYGAHTGADLSATWHSWATAAFTLASFVGVISAQPLEQRLGMRRYFVGGALLLACFGLLQALMPSQPALLAMRSFEGLASGSFGPRALLAAFMFYRAGRLPMATALAVFFLFVAGVIGFVMFGASESVLGSRGLFLVQFAVGLLMALAGVRWLPSIKRMVSRAPICSVASASIQRSFSSSRRRRRGYRHGACPALRSRAP
ncbi:MFS transporter [Lysobacter terrae]